MRIAVGGIHTECSTYSPVLMQPEDFFVLRGNDLTTSGYFSFLPRTGVKLCPLLHARAVPGGPLAQATYESFKAEFIDRLKATLPVDGVYLAMHGAMNVEGMDDAEGDWIAAVRDVVGPDLPIAASYDLHGNVSQKIVDQLDIFAGYRTAPHIDVRETMVRAYSMLVDCLTSGERPGVAWVPVPVLLPGEKTSTEDPPAAGLYEALPGYDNADGILDANLMVGYVWADEPRATACAVVTGTDKMAAAQAAEAIAKSYWEARADFRFGPVAGSLAEMMALVESSQTQPVILADSGDNPTGGGVGDRADVLGELLRRGFEGALLAGITDAPSVQKCFKAEIGATLRLVIGGALDPSSRPVEVTARLLTLDDQPGSLQDERQAVLEIGGNTVVLAARRRPYHNIADFTRLGLDPHSARLVVVKSGYLSPELAPIATPNLMALTDGVVNQDIERLPNRRRQGPSYPFDKGFAFTPTARFSARWKD
ncbi:M81 family metallopeptidase [Labrenzia sp. OB1]|uniref:M81 family metallopeptidase n=1 Tax=Labrenzia sp. OB1 TaxID=1561204 RepID=UPI0007B1CC29|nr:M81 family metallopeptidase [Labrenzia sp. OB1]KZM50111.1 microcystin degradation protein MlrC [Labrenzia sp. OB1]